MADVEGRQREGGGGEAKDGANDLMGEPRTLPRPPCECMYIVECVLYLHMYTYACVHYIEAAM